MQIGWSIIIISFLNLIWNINQLSGDLCSSVQIIQMNRALIAEKLYQYKSPNAVDPDESDPENEDLEDSGPNGGYVYPDDSGIAIPSDLEENLENTTRNDKLTLQHF